MLKKLKPMREKESMSDVIRDRIERYLWEVVYAPFVDLFGIKKREASKANLKKALLDGEVQYRAGGFEGRMSASVSKDLHSLGAKWNKARKCFVLQWEQVPADVQRDILIGDQNRRDFEEDLKRRMKEVDERKENRPILDFQPSIDRVMKDLDMQFTKSVKPIITVQPELPVATEKTLRMDYEDRLDHYTKAWEEDAKFRLRKMFEDSSVKGIRASAMKDKVMNEWGVSKNKAKLIARQETSLVLSKYAQYRYQDAGVEKYMWSTSKDQRVRPDHKALDGRTFDWSHPPIVDKATGERAHPGESINCRCVSIPIVTV